MDKIVLRHEFRTIHAAFSQLATAFGKIAPILSPVPEPVMLTGTGRPRKKPRLTAATRAALKLPGKYMGTPPASSEAA
mgnify:CR=1 FL=1